MTRHPKLGAVERRLALSVNFLSKALAIDPKYEKARLLLLEAIEAKQSKYIQ